MGVDDSRDQVPAHRVDDRRAPRDRDVDSNRRDLPVLDDHGTAFDRLT